jgi:hypothetical protein
MHVLPRTLPYVGEDCRPRQSSPIPRVRAPPPLPWPPLVFVPTQDAMRGVVHVHTA